MKTPQIQIPKAKGLGAPPFDTSNKATCCQAVSLCAFKAEASKSQSAEGSQHKHWCAQITTFNILLRSRRLFVESVSRCHAVRTGMNTQDFYCRRRRAQALTMSALAKSVTCRISGEMWGSVGNAGPRVGVGIIITLHFKSLPSSNGESGAMVFVRETRQSPVPSSFANIRNHPIGP